MDKIYTIGFTQKDANYFFETLKTNGIGLVLDIRLNNSSQLSGFSKYPDIKYFLKKLCTIDYIHDTKFSPTESTLKRYKKKEINWNQYCLEFSKVMIERNIKDYIKLNFSLDKYICLLCSESSSNNCHRSLVANEFRTIFENCKIINL